MSDFFKSSEQPLNLLDEQAFEANRRGEITAAQQARLSAAVNWTIVILLVLVMYAIGTVFSIVIFPVILIAAYRGNILGVFFVGGISLAILFIMGYFIWSQRSKIVKPGYNAASRVILQGQGQLAHNGADYVFEMGSRTLAMFGGQANGLLPGAIYQVYSLEENGFLLSAAVYKMPTPAQAQAELNKVLASVHGFSRDDLLSNRKGVITASQRKKFVQKTVFGVLVMLGCILLISALLYVILFLGQINAIIFLFIFGWIVVLLIFGFGMFRESLQDVYSTHLQQVQGQVYKKHRVLGIGKSKKDVYDYIIKGMYFRVDYRAYAALIDGLQYRIYYLPHNKKLIAIEVGLFEILDGVAVSRADDKL